MMITVITMMSTIIMAFIMITIVTTITMITISTIIASGIPVVIVVRPHSSCTLNSSASEGVGVWRYPFEVTFAIP